MKLGISAALAATITLVLVTTHPFHNRVTPTQPGPLRGTLAATLPDPASKGVTSVAFAPDGTTLATGNANGSIRLWNTATRRITATLPDPASKGVTSVAFAPDGTTLATGNANGSIRLWNTATRRITATLPDPASKGVTSVAFAPDGTRLAVADTNGKAYLWNIKTRKIAATFTAPHETVEVSIGVVFVAFAPDGTTLAVADLNGITSLWDTTTMKITATLTTSASDAVWALAFAPGGTTLAAADQNGSTYLWHLAHATASPTPTTTGPEFVRNLTMPGPAPYPDENAIDIDKGQVIINAAGVGSLIYKQLTTRSYELDANYAQGSSAAVLLSTDPTPTSPAQCLQAVQTHPFSSERNLSAGLRICVESDGGTALIVITNLDSSGAFSLRETYWENG
jgi:hypothetical protein